jgi:aspartate aminotransferase
VLEAEKRIMTAGKNKEYAGIAGMKDFVDLSLKFAYGDDCLALKQNRITGVQVSLLCLILV